MTKHLPVALILFATFATPGLSAEEKLKGREFFEKTIRPVLVKKCYSCHSSKAKEVKGNLLLDTRSGIRKGGDTGYAIIPGDVKESLLIEAIRRDEENVSAMPPKEALPEEVIADFIKWVKMGAPDPRDGKVAVSNTIEFEQARRFWAFQLPKKQPVPDVKNTAWPQSDIDRFVLAKLEAQGLAPTGDVDRIGLIRRITFDLIGLPPTPQEVDGFVNDNSSNAFEKVVNRLLSSPLFGERWGRHWLDVARYAESTGKERNYTYPHAWRYRDYVIDSFNKDKPYDRFVQEQIAGDLLSTQRDSPRIEMLIATGFLTLGPKSLNERNQLKFEMDVVDDQIDTTGRAFLGLTVGCARCHDHKFDPIPTSDYYALAGIFRSTDTLAGVAPGKRAQNGGNLVSLLGDKRSGEAEQHSKTMKALQARLSKTQKALKTLQANRNRNRKNTPKSNKKATKNNDETDDRVPNRKPVAAEKPRNPNSKKFVNNRRKKNLKNNRQQANKKVAAMRARAKQLQTEIAKLKKHAPPPPEKAMGVREGKQPADSQIFIRGDVDNLGERIPRGYVTVITPNTAPKIAKSHSGRLELARWLTSRDNPLTARVMVNRIWQHLFGTGIVSTVDNFGSLGEKPSHPELLDYLSVRFMEKGWSVKTMIRMMVRSRVYQLDTAHIEANYAVDPANRLLWRMSHRRLDAEAIRDAILSVSGQLDLKPLEGSPVTAAGSKEIGRQLNADSIQMDGNHRSVYLPVLRGAMPTILKVFDVADPSLVVGRRDVTTAAPQALFMMNSPFVMEQSDHAARRLLSHEELDDEGRVELAYKLALGRSPSEAETERVLQFIKGYRQNVEEVSKRDMNASLDAWSSFCQTLFACAEFRYVY